MSAASRVLVSGGGGFVGQHLIRRLVADGAQVTCILKGGSRPEQQPEAQSQVDFQWHDGSTEGMVAIVLRSQPDVVFHLASLFLSEHTSSDITPLLTSNVLFGTQLLEAMIQIGTGDEVFVNVGTSWQHRDGSAYDPVNLYAATKQAFEDVLKYYVSAHGLRAVTLRLFDTYGDRDPRRKLVHLLSRATETGETLSMSPGEQKLDLVHVEDVVEALVSAAIGLADGSLTTGSAFAVSSGRRLSLREVVEIYQTATGSHLEVQWGGRPYRPREVMSPWKSGVALPGWTPRWTLEEGFRRMGDNQ